MLKDITLGQYYPADSVIHRLDPRVKLLGTLVYIIVLFVFGRPANYIAAAVFLGCMIRLSKVPLRFMVRGLRSIFLLVLFTAAFNLFLTPGTAVVRFWRLTITREGIEVTVRMAVRLVLLVMGSSVMTLTTTPNDLTDGLEKGLRMFKRIGVPVHGIAMMMSIALRFIPILMEETDKIMKAQTARGADFESGGLIARAKSLVPILVPLFISAFRRANDLAMAMEARGYHGGDNRTKMRPLEYKRRDGIAYLTLILFVALMFALSKIRL